MNKSQQNFIIDALSLAAFLLLVSTGLLMRYALPPGSGHDVTIWGLDRHEWGGLHFWVSLVFIALMIIHLIWHWSWIVKMVRGKSQRSSSLRTGIAVALFVLIAAIAFAPLLSSVKEERRETTTSLSVQSTDGLIIRGSMTLGELEKQSGVPATHVLESLDLPAGTSEDTRLGNLVRMYDLEMDDIRTVVERHEE